MYYKEFDCYNLSIAGHGYWQRERERKNNRSLAKIQIREKSCFFVPETGWSYQTGRISYFIDLPVFASH